MSAARDDAQRRREEARRRRREAARPSEEPQETPGPAGREDGSAPQHDADSHDGLKQTMRVAAAGAAVGAAAGAASAFASKNHRDEDDSDDGDSARDGSADPRPREVPAAQEAPAIEGSDDRADAQHEPEPEPQREEEPEPDPEPVRGRAPGETAAIVRRAQEQLVALRGQRPELLSSLERTRDGWTATFEVVELARIPNSTDVMATYDVVLDEDGNVVRYTRTRRYYRSQAEREARA